jgi:hypothetical protein
LTDGSISNAPLRDFQRHGRLFGRVLAELKRLVVADVESAGIGRANPRFGDEQVDLSRRQHLRASRFDLGGGGVVLYRMSGCQNVGC